MLIHRLVWGAGMVAALTCLCTLPACRSRAKASKALDRPPVAAPVVRGAERGLEVWSWIVSDQRRITSPEEPLEAGQDPGTPNQPASRPRTADRPPPINFTVNDGRTDIEALLTPYLDRPVPMSPSSIARWKASGFRIVSVPIADLEKIQASSRIIGQVQRQWLGDITDWTDAVRGPTLEERRAITLNDGVATLEPGRLRLMVRCWIIPAGDGPDGAVAAAHVDVSPRHDPAVAERERLFAAAGMTAETQPLFLAQLATTMTVREESALLFVPETPAADWSGSPPPPSDPAAQPYGPNPVAPASLGEVMFSSPAARGAPRTRAIIALVIRIPARFELLPR